MKAVSTGAMLVASVMVLMGGASPVVRIAAPVIALLFVTLTSVVLIADLERPERFYYILTRPNWRSWLVRGTWFLIAHGAISTAWLIAGWMEWNAALVALAIPALIVSVLATSYTGFLFAQGLGRDLWQGSHAAIDLIAQSWIAGTATLLVVTPLSGVSYSDGMLVYALILGLLAHMTILLFENVLSPSPTRHHELALDTIRRGAYARLFWGGAVGAGGLVPLLLISILIMGGTGWGTLGIAACVLALAGGAAWDYIWVEAGQSVPLS